MADPREARFLASQAERLAGNNKKQQQISNSNNCKINDSSPELVNEDNSTATDAIDNTSIKAQSNQFFTNFRKICSQYQGQIDTLLLVPSSTSDLANDCTATTESSNYTEAKAYYATSTKRNEGQLELNSILNNVRTLQRHALSSSSSINTYTESISTDNENDELLQSILQTPMTDITQTDIRLISSELDNIIKYIDVAREIICPKEKFIFKRYRQAMAEQKMLEGESSADNIIHSTSEASVNESKEEKEDEKQQQDNLRTKYGGVLDDMSNCTVEISASGTVLVNETTQDDLQFYSAPRSVHTLHPPSHTADDQQQANESSSYLLQNLSNVTILIHGTRPSLHLQHIYNCKVYISQPTLGPVHVTDCTSSIIHCSCYQLRIHESKDVRFKCWVRSGPIIEDCTGMVFEGNYYSNEEGNNLYWDVKDFNWLRTLRKSPNFVVVSDTKESGEEKVEAVSEKKLTPEVSSAAEATLAEEEEDSEDEL